MFLYCETRYFCRVSRDSRGKCFLSRILTGNIQEQCSPLASGSRWWGWHTNLRMLLVDLLLSFILSIQVFCVLSTAVFFHLCHNVTPCDPRHAGNLEHISGCLQCNDGPSQDASCYTTPIPFSEKQVRGLMGNWCCQCIKLFKIL